jgi:hypothetical protein
VVVAAPVSVGTTVTVVYVVVVLVVAESGAPRSLCVSTTSSQTSLRDLRTSWVSGNRHYHRGATTERAGAGVSRIDRGAPSTPCSRAGGSGIDGCS